MSSHIVTGLAFGDEGKGSWVDHLCRLHNIKTVVRFNGGAQALHHVTTAAGVTHGFSQFGSHSFMPGAKTLLSRFMLIEPLTLLAEAEDLKQKGVVEPIRSLFISERAPIIPYSNVLLNRAMESFRGNSRHGSCGLGIGLTQQNVEELSDGALRAGDILGPRKKLREKLVALVEWAVAAAADWESESSTSFVSELRQFDVASYEASLLAFAKQVRIIPESAFLGILRRTPAVFEGAQGALLDQWQGFFPYCTRSTTTSANAEQLLKEAGYTKELTRHGLLRAYGTRHGAGPFVTEASVSVPACDNNLGEWQGAFRHGWFDAVAARFALEFSKVDGVVITNLDRLDRLKQLKIASGYQGMSSQFYDRATSRLRLVSDYETSKIRTGELFTTNPVYESVSGWNNQYDSAQVEYVKTVEDLIGFPIVALSQRKDHQKVYR